MSASIVISRRGLLRRAGGFGLAAVAGGFSVACTAAATKPVPMTVHKDPNCGCCAAWAERMAASGHFAPTLVDHVNLIEVKTRLGVPPELAACHTTEVGGYVVEGHVPAADIVRLLRDKPAGIVGLGVPGMPAGSPGMEMPDGRRDPYEVIAFTADGRATIFARHLD